jgi:hypothetical protein
LPTKSARNRATSAVVISSSGSAPNRGSRWSAKMISRWQRGSDRLHLGGERGNEAGQERHDGRWLRRRRCLASELAPARALDIADLLRLLLDFLGPAPQRCDHGVDLGLALLHRDAQLLDGMLRLCP